VKFRPVGAELFNVDGRTDMKMLIVAFRNFSNAPENQSVNAVCRNNRCLFWDPYKTYKYTVWAEFTVYNAKLGGTISNYLALKSSRLTMDIFTCKGTTFRLFSPHLNTTNCSNSTRIMNSSTTDFFYLYLKTKLDQPPWKNGQHQTPETRPQLHTSRKKRS
jgi:hypothetical protein